MPTETQKNFRKEMNQHINEKNETKNSSYFSYIENDFIDDYYTIKKKRRRKIYAGSFIAVIILFISMHSQIFAMTNMISKIVFNKSVSIPTISASFLSNQKYDFVIVTEYMKFIKAIHAQNDVFAKETASLKSNFDSKVITKNIYLLELRNIKEKYLQNYLDLKVFSEKNLPRGFEKYNVVILKQLSSEAHYIDSIMIYAENPTQNNFNQLNADVHEINYYSDEIYNELQAVFDALNIEYETGDDKIIHYTLKENNY